MANFSKRQLEIIYASIALIGEGGIQEFTIKNLANKIGFVEAAAYRHFKSKSDILFAVLTFLEDIIIKKFDEIKQKDESPLVRIKSTINEYFSYFSNNPALITVHLSDGIYKNEPTVQSKVLNIMDDTISHFKYLIDESASKGEIRADIDSSELALIIVGTMRITVTRWALKNNSFDINSDTEKIFSILQTLLIKES